MKYGYMMKILLKEKIEKRLKDALKIKTVMPKNLTLAIASLVAAIAVWVWVTKNVVSP
jgi:hypothetical protein